MKNLITILFLSIILCSCSKSDDNGSAEQFDGSEEAIENFFSDEVLQSMKDLGFPVNQGANPPIINGDYLMSPVELVKSNIVNDVVGKIYSNLNLKFSNQSNETLSINFEAVEGDISNIIGVQSFISGKDNKFSVFVKVNSTKNNHTSIVAYGYSGVLLSDSIEDLYSVLIMLDDKGDPDSNLIENGQGRLFKDGDGVSPKQ